MALIAICDYCPELVSVDGAADQQLPPGWDWRVGPGGQMLLYCPKCRAAQDLAGREFHRELVARGWREGQWGRA